MTDSTSALGTSERLRRFVDEAPDERLIILEFASGGAEEHGAGDRAADVGAGDTSYRESFSHHDYIAIDWAESIHLGGATADIVPPDG